MWSIFDIFDGGDGKSSSTETEKTERSGVSAGETTQTENTPTTDDNKVDKVREQLRDHIKKREGDKPNIYTDPSGVPTVGYGAAMGKVGENKNTRREEVQLNTKEDINKMLRESGNPEIDDTQYSTMQKQVDSWNNGSTEERKAMQGKDVAGIDYKLTDKDKLLDMRLDERMASANKKMDELNISHKNMPESVQVAVYDSYYRGGTNVVLGVTKDKDGKVIQEHRNVKALRNGDWGAVAAEIEYASNKEGYAGNDKRNSALSRRILNEMPEVQTGVDTWKNQHPEQVKKRTDRQEGYKQDPQNYPWAKEPLSMKNGQGKPANSLTAEQNQMFDSGKRIASIMAEEAMGGNVKTSDQQDMHNNLTQVMGRVLMDLNPDFDNTQVLNERPDLITDNRLKGADTDNEQAFKGIVGQVQSEMASMKQAGNSEDVGETVKRVVMQNLPKIKFSPKDNIMPENDMFKDNLIANNEDISRENQKRGEDLFATKVTRTPSIIEQPSYNTKPMESIREETSPFAWLEKSRKVHF